MLLNLLHPPLVSAGVSVGMERGSQLIVNTRFMGAGSK